MIGEELAAFLQEGIAIEMGTRNAALEPNGVRVFAATVDPDGTHLTAYVHEDAAKHVLPDLEANGHAALVFARPPDERACQVKGLFAGAHPATDAELAIVAAQWQRWLDRLASIGCQLEVFQHWQTTPCVAIRVKPTALFNQTPGPGAGGPLV